MCIAQAGIIEPSVQTHLQPDTINYINKTLYKGTKIYGRKDN